MNHVVNGMSAKNLADAAWHRSTRIDTPATSVEVAQLPSDVIAVRNSRDPEGPALIFTREEMAAFVASAKAGEFDLPDAVGDHPDDAADRYPRNTGSGGKTPARYDAIGEELQHLTARLLSGDAELDRESSERLIRILSGIALLHRMHRVDRHGNCTICRTKTRRWHPSTRHDECSVYAALSLHLGRSLMVSSEPEDVSDPALRAAAFGAMSS